MSDEKPVIIRPIRWAQLRTDEAEREIKRRLAIADPFVLPHAFERLEEREEQGRLNSVDMMKILRSGSVRAQPRMETKGWVVIMEKRMPGTRVAGVVTLLIHPGNALVVKTVEWIDWL